MFDRNSAISCLIIYLFIYLSSHCLCIRCILSFDPRCKLQYMTGWSQDENPVISDSIISCNNFTPIKYRKQINSLALDTALTLVDKHTWYGCSSWTSARHLMTLFQISCWTKFMHWLKYVTRYYISSPNAPRLQAGQANTPSLNMSTRVIAILLYMLCTHNCQSIHNMDITDHSTHDWQQTGCIQWGGSHFDTIVSNT